MGETNILGDFRKKDLGTYLILLVFDDNLIRENLFRCLSLFFKNFIWILGDYIFKCYHKECAIGITQQKLLNCLIKLELLDNFFLHNLQTIDDFINKHVNASVHHIKIIVVYLLSFFYNSI